MEKRDAHRREWETKTRVRERQRAVNTPVAEYLAVEKRDALWRKLKSGKCICSRIVSKGKARRVSVGGSERAGTCSRIVSFKEASYAPEKGRQRAMHL